MHFKFYFVYGIVCLSPHECGLRIHYSCQDLTCSFTTSVEISSYTTSWKPYYKNPGYAPAINGLKWMGFSNQVKINILEELATYIAALQHSTYIALFILRYRAYPAAEA